jgi:hypothetical protein
MMAPPSLATKINIPHCTKMALIHDMAEALVGESDIADKRLGHVVDQGHLCAVRDVDLSC